MQKWIACLALVMCAAFKLHAQDAYADKVAKYVQQYKALAIAEQQRCGIPASIILGQGILETEAGCSELATQANNHFGIKCKKEWKGETFSHTDDLPDECFRKYDCAASSYKDHSDYLKNTPRYASLFTLSPNDYKGWATGLKRCGYATSPTYATRLINIIEQFNLGDYTLMAQGEKVAGGNLYAAADTPGLEKVKPAADDAKASIEAEPAYQAGAPVKQSTVPDFNGIITVNGLKAIYAHKGDQLLRYAMQYDVRYAKLLEINELPDAPLSADMYIFLERKAVKGSHSIHIVTDGETVHSIAQEEGIQAKRLMLYNHLAPGDEPQPGNVLQLQDYAAEAPATEAKQQPFPVDTTAQVNAAQDAATAQQQTDDYVATKASTPLVQDNAAASSNTAVTATMPDNIGATTSATPQGAAVTENTATTTPQPATTATEAPTSTPDEPATAPATNTSAAGSDYISKSAIAADAPAEKVTTPAAAANATQTDGDGDVAPARNTNSKESDQEDDIDKIKSQLDRIVYSDNTTQPATSAAPATDNTAPPAADNASAGSDEANYYTVKKGDTAYSIAKHSNITVHQLMALNHLDFDGIKVGQRLRIK